MPFANVYDMDGNIVREEELDPYVFDAPVNVGMLHQVVTSQLVNRRQGTASTKTRAEVSGGGKKPYRQKGTGRARQGSPRAPQWRTGGTVFGPQPHPYENKVPRKMSRNAIRAALSDKAASGRILLMEELVFEAPHTNEMQSLLDNLPLERHVLLLMPERDENVILSAHNIQRIKMGHVDSTNVVEILKYDHLLMPIETVKRLVEIFGEAADDALAMKRHPQVVARRQARRAAAAVAAAAATAAQKTRARKTEAKTEAKTKADAEAKTGGKKAETPPPSAKAPRTTRSARSAASPTEGEVEKSEPESKSGERTNRSKSRTEKEEE
jgi:large subunit ribosomal protein L4